MQSKMTYGATGYAITAASTAASTAAITMRKVLA